MALCLRHVFSQRIAVSCGNRFYASRKGNQKKEDPAKLEVGQDSDKEARPSVSKSHGGRSLVEFDVPKDFDEMPSVKPFPIIGSAWSYFPKIGLYRPDKQHIADREKYAAFGPVVKEKYGTNYLVLTFNGKDVETIINSEEEYPVRGEFSSVLMYRKKRRNLYRTVGLNALRGKQWWDLRMATEAHLGNKSQIEMYGDVIGQISSEFLEKIHSLRNYTNEVITFMEEIYKWALESLCVIAMDRRLGALKTLSKESDPTLLISSLKEQLDCMSKMEASAGSLGLWRHVPHPIWLTYCDAADTFSRIAFEYVSKTMMLAVNKDNGGGFLERMVHDENLKLNDISVLCVDMLFEGLYTTASAVTFLLYNLATNPEKQQKLHDEIILFQTLNPGLLPSFDRIPYLDYCFKEAMRLNPVSRGVARTFETPISLSGYLVPPNVTVLAITQLMTRLETHFKNANEFIPERWEDAETMTRKGHLCMPFGYGKRSCLGRRVAELQISILVAEMLKRYKVEYRYKSLEIETKLINLPVEPVIFRFTQR